jgi:hypothetical protein
VHGIRLALREVAWGPGVSPERHSPDAKLAHLLLVHELRRSVGRAFGTVPVCASHQPGPYGQQQGPYGSPQNPYTGGNSYAGGDGNPYAGGGAHGGGGFGGFGDGRPAPQPPRGRRGFWAGCGCSGCCAAPANCAAPRSTRDRGPVRSARAAAATATTATAAAPATAVSRCASSSVLGVRSATSRWPSPSCPTS